MAINDLGPVLIELQRSDSHIQWRPQSTGDWIDLVPLEDIMCPTSIELRQQANYVQWRVKNIDPEDTWKDLYLIPKGDQGASGKQGLAGQSARISTESTATYHDPLTNATPTVHIDTAGNDLQRIFQFRFEFADPVRVNDDHDHDPKSHPFILDEIRKAALAGQQWLKAVNTLQELNATYPSADLEHSDHVNYLCYVRSDPTASNNGTWQHRAGATAWEFFSGASDFVRPDTLQVALDTLAPTYAAETSRLTIEKGSGIGDKSVILQATITADAAVRTIPSVQTHNLHNLFQTIRNNLRWLTERFQADTTHVNTAVSLASARNLQVNLASTTARSFNGTANVLDIGVSGTLPIANGGTGASDAVEARKKLGITPNDIGSGVTNADMSDSGRNLFDVLEVSTISDAMAKLRSRCNGAGTPDFKGLMIGDYIDGIDLSGIAAPANGTAPQAWNATYKNNRIVIAGFNTYKGAGDTENTLNHILFVFRHCIARGRMNATDTNTGGYPASEIRTWLEGANGDGSGVFATGLKTALGGEYLYPIRKCHSRKGSSGWNSYTVFLPTEIEVFGYQAYGDELTYYDGSWRYRSVTNVQFPIYQKGYEYRIKRWNGARQWYWLHTPFIGSTVSFCNVGSLGYPSYNLAVNTGSGVSPAFCVR